MRTIEMAESNLLIRRHERTDSKRHWGRIGIALLTLLPVFASGCRRTAASAPVAPRVEVTVAKPLVRKVSDYEDFIGRTKAADFVEVRSRVTGYLVKILFEDGDDVKRAQPLFEIDPRPFRAEYNKALADVKIADANLKLRKTDVERNRPLVAKNTVTQADFHKMVAQLEEAEATLESRRATADTAKLNLSFTHILSPIEGRASRAKVTYGNLVQADSTLLTTVVSVDPIYVYFNADEETHLRVQAAAREGKLKLDKGKVDVWMELASESGFPHRGVIDFSENEVDAATGTIEIRGVFANPKPARGNRILQPGLFCRVRVPLGEPYQAILVAERAIGSDQGQKYVLVVKSDHKVEYRSVELGRLEDGLRVIRAGITPDDQVIVSGTQRARAGAMVEESLVDMSTYGRPREQPAVGDHSSPAPETPKGPREVPKEIDPAVNDDQTGNDPR
jgi:RND family efflux transporter MFP subunit